MNLHDWIDELSDLLDVDTEADEALLGDLAGVAIENVDHNAGPVTAFLLGVAAGARDAGPDTIERMAARVQALAEAWDRPADVAVAEDDDVEVEVDVLDELELDDEEEDVVVCPGSEERAAPGEATGSSSSEPGERGTSGSGRSDRQLVV